MEFPISKPNPTPKQALMRAKCCSRLSKCPLATIWRIRSGSIIADRKRAVTSRSYPNSVQWLGSSFRNENETQNLPKNPKQNNEKQNKQKKNTAEIIQDLECWWVGVPSAALKKPHFLFNLNANRYPLLFKYTFTLSHTILYIYVYI